MTKVIPVTDSIFRTYLQVISRMMVLSNAICEIDNRVSVNVEWSSRPNAIHIVLFRWNERDEIETADYYYWYYDYPDAEQTKEQLFAKIAEWEEKYGLL